MDGDCDGYNVLDKNEMDELKRNRKNRLRKERDGEGKRYWEKNDIEGSIDGGDLYGDLYEGNERGNGRYMEYGFSEWDEGKGNLEKKNSDF